MKLSVVYLAFLCCFTGCTVQSPVVNSPAAVSDSPVVRPVSSPAVPSDAPSDTPEELSPEPSEDQNLSIRAADWAALWDDNGLYEAPDGAPALPPLITAVAQSVLTLSAGDADLGLLSASFTWGTLIPLAAALAGGAEDISPSVSDHKDGEFSPADPVLTQTPDGSISIPGWRLRQYALALYDFQERDALPPVTEPFSQSLTLDADGNALLTRRVSPDISFQLVDWKTSHEGNRRTATLHVSRKGEAERFAEAVIELHIREESLFRWAVSAATANFG